MRLDRDGSRSARLKRSNSASASKTSKASRRTGHISTPSARSPDRRPSRRRGWSGSSSTRGTQSINGVEVDKRVEDFPGGERSRAPRDEGEKKGKEGGLNIEGLAWDPRRNRLLLALRSPIMDGHALARPAQAARPSGQFSIENLEVEGSRAIRMPLGGIGIRGIEFDARANVFRIISGASEDQGKTDFGLWEWNGDDQQPVLQETTRFDNDLKPEGVAQSDSRRTAIFLSSSLTRAATRLWIRQKCFLQWSVTSAKKTNSTRTAANSRT